MANPLGEYLRARREQVDPGSVGLRVAGVRRTPGLRREEVATLAGISADYYLRLEQGRDRNPSPQVLDALARVLHLDAAATQHLFGLAGNGLARNGKARRPRTRRETVPAGIRQLLAQLDLPAFVESRTFEVIAANAAAMAFSPRLVPGANRLRAMFLDEDERALYPDWDRMVGGLVAAARASIGADTDDPRIAQLIGELSLGSEQFSRLWARHDVKPMTGVAVRVSHPVLGELEIRNEKLPIADSGGQLLVILHAEPGSASARALRRLRGDGGDGGDDGQDGAAIVGA